MATNFSANQYENAFAGKRLQNWEIAAKFKERPSRLEGYTKTIADNRGHLLQGIQRSDKCPWGGFVGTWDSGEQKTKPIQQAGKSYYNGTADILNVHSLSPPQSASKQHVEKPLSPVPQPFDEKNIGISKHLEEVKNTEAQEASKVATPSPRPKTAERTPSPVERKPGVEDVSIQAE